jgi:arabinan endo-1,5-alpha-L-arabinosidase
MGSFWTGIKQVQVDSTGALKSTAITALAQRSGASTAMEASVVFQYGSYYYLFTSWDKCCSGTSSTYNIRVGRSSSFVPSLASGITLRLTVDKGRVVDMSTRTV